jgi:GR25 family glycosyltransferase involved in LPS biosynthesis
MTDLPVCRWREHRDGGALYCRSEKYVSPPNRVNADFCLSCGYRDHTPAAAPVILIDDLLPAYGLASPGARPPGDLPPMFCITCRQTPERTALAAAHFRERGLSVHFFPGIHGKTFGLRTVLNAAPGYRMPAGFVGGLLSHYMLWQTLAYLPFGEVLILEDDAWFAPDFPARFREARAELPGDWQFVFVGSAGTADTPALRMSPHVSQIHFPVGTHAYLIKRSVLPFLLRTNHQARNHIDLQLIENSLPALKCFTFTPSLVKQRSTVAPADGTGENWPSTSAVPDVDPEP